MIRTLPTTLLQISCKTIPNSKVIVKNIIAPDDNFRMKPYAWGPIDAYNYPSQRYNVPHYVPIPY